MKKKTRKLSIQTKVLLVTSIVTIALVLLMGTNFYLRMQEDMIGMAVEQAEVAARIAVNQVDGDAIATLQAGDESTEAYLTNLQALKQAKETCGVAFLYTLSTDEKKVYYGIDVDESENRQDIGNEFGSSYEELKLVFEGQAYVQDYLDYTDDGVLITAYLPIMNSTGQVVAILGSDYDASNVASRLNGIKMRIFQIGGAGILVSMILLWLVIRSITKSLWTVNEKIYDLVHSEGDLTQKLQITTGDETELMAENVNALLAYICDIMKNISNNSVQLNQSCVSVADHLSSTGGNIFNISSTMEEMSAAMQETSASLNQVNESIVNAYNRTNSISATAEQGSEFAETIRQRAQNIHEVAEKEQKNAAALTKEITTSVNQKIEDSKTVAEINVLTENIINITEQTNLLALNASIEAARAGEVGRGFAVVASEIGKLATDSASAAEKIAQVSSGVVSSVEGLAQEADRMVHFMEKTAMEGYRRLFAASEDYHKDAENIYKSMNHFAKEAEQMEDDMDTIKETLQAINIAAEESAQGICNVSGAIADLSESINSIETEAEANKEIANQMENEVNKFKIE